MYAASPPHSHFSHVLSQYHDSQKINLLSNFPNTIKVVERSHMYSLLKTMHSLNVFYIGYLFTS